jgi:tetratricopeptide (TPR) repeat protein
MTARPRNDVAYADALADAIALLRRGDPAPEWFFLADLLDELASTYCHMGRFDDALMAMREAIDAGAGGQPDVRCRIAEILMQAGRVEEAEPIWTQVRAATPDDVWLYNNAGLEYAAVGDHATALTWLTEGLRIALATDDPERLVDQLMDERGASMTALGLPADELQDRAGAFHEATQRDRAARHAARGAPAPRDVAAPARPLVVAFAWFPAGEYEQALTRWPGLTEPGGGPAEGGRPYYEYCRALQARLIEAADAGATGLRIAPLRVDALVAWCAERGVDPDDARADYAADLARTSPDGVIAWPPRRNAACWCGLTRKYKKCCGAPTAGGHD